MKLKEIYLNEMTTSSATPGYMTPKAFTGKNVDRKNLNFDGKANIYN